MGQRGGRGELVVVHEHVDALFVHHPGHLGCREGSIEVDDVGSELGCGDAGLQEQAPVARQHADGRVLAEAGGPPRRGQGRRAQVELAERDLGFVVDNCDARRMFGGAENDDACRVGPPAPDRGEALQHAARRLGG
jgi:hypothetical protein